MTWWKRRIALRVVPALISVIAGVWLALWYFIPAPPSTITIAAGIKGGAFSTLAEHYRERLAKHHITLNIRFGKTGEEDLKLLENPKSGVDATFLFGGISNSQQAPNVLSLGRINYAPLWIFYRGTETIDRLAQLKGKRININIAIPSLTKKILAAHGVTSENTTMSELQGRIAIKALKNGDLDAVTLPPQDPHSPIMQPL